MNTDIPDNDDDFESKEPRILPPIGDPIGGDGTGGEGGDGTGGESGDGTGGEGGDGTGGEGGDGTGGEGAVSHWS